MKLSLRCTLVRPEPHSTIQQHHQQNDAYKKKHVAFDNMLLELR